MSISTGFSADSSLCPVVLNWLSLKTCICLLSAGNWLNECCATAYTAPSCRACAQLSRKTAPTATQWSCKVWMRWNNTSISSDSQQLHMQQIVSAFSWGKPCEFRQSISRHEGSARSSVTACLAQLQTHAAAFSSPLLWVLQHAPHVKSMQNSHAKSSAVKFWLITHLSMHLNAHQARSQV